MYFFDAATNMYMVVQVVIYVAVTGKLLKLDFVMRFLR